MQFLKTLSNILSNILHIGMISKKSCSYYKMVMVCLLLDFMPHESKAWSTHVL